MKLLNFLLMPCILFALCACQKDKVDPGDDGQEVPPVDEKQDVTIGFDTTYFTADETVGITKIPVTITGRLSDDLTFVVRSVDGTAVSVGNAWDYKLTDSIVKISKGDSVGFVNISLQDSKATKEDRSFKLRITGLTGVSAGDTTLSIRENVRESEVVIRKVPREVSFGDTLIAVSESAKSLDFWIALTGPVDKDVTVTFEPKDGGTAIEGLHYTLASKQLTIKKGEIKAGTTLTIIDDKFGNRDRFCDFEIVEVSEDIDVAADVACRLVIQNDDSSVGLGDTLVCAAKGDTLFIPVLLNGLLDKKAVVDLEASMDDESNTGQYFALTKTKLEFAAGDSLVYAEVRILNPDAASFKFNVKIKQVTGENQGTSLPIETNAAVCKIYVLPAMTASASSNAAVSGNEGGAAFLIDGNMDTYWHSDWSNSSVILPHWVQVDLGTEYNINYVEMWRRGGTNNDIKTCILQLSLDGVTWEDVDTYFFSEAADKYRLTEFGPTSRARYVRYYITESNRPPHACIAEIKITKTFVPD